MASNYVQLNWLEPSWDDDQVGTLSSLERRQRKAAEKQDVNAFYSTLGFLFVIILVLLVWSEISAEISLTVAFLLELWHSATLAYQQLRIFYEYAKEVGLTCLAVVYGPDYQQRGVTEIAHGAAKLLARGLFYLAVLLSGLIMCSTYQHVAHAPLQTAAYTTVAAGLIFGAPPLYALVVSRLCQHCSPQAVVLLALLIALVMCLTTIHMGSKISRMLSRRKVQQGPSAKQRNQSAGSRRLAAGAAAGGPGSSSGTGAPGGGASSSSLSSLKDGAGASGGTAAGQKRAGASGATAGGRNFSRTSSSSVRSAGGGAGSACDGGPAAAVAAAAAAPFDPTRPGPGAGRAASSSSFTGSVPTANTPAASNGIAFDPTRPTSRSSGGLHSGGSSSLDLCGAGGPAQPKPGSQGQPFASGKPGSLQSGNLLPPDPVAYSRSGSAGASTGRAGGGSGNLSTCPSAPAVHSANGGASASSSAAAKNTSANSASKQQQHQQQQRHGSGGSLANADCSSAHNGSSGKASGKASAAPHAAAAQAASRAASVDPVAPVTGAAPSTTNSTSSSSGVGTSGRQLQQQSAAVTHVTPKPSAAVEPVSAPGTKKKGAAGSGLGSGSGSTSGGSLSNGHAAAPAAASRPSAHGPATAAAAVGSGVGANLVTAAAAPAAATGPSAGTSKPRPDTAAVPKNGVTTSAASHAAPGANGTAGAHNGKASMPAPAPVPTAPSPAPAPAAALPASGTSAAGLLSRLTSTVAPALSSRVAKKAPTAVRKPAAPPASVQPLPTPPATPQPPQPQAPQLAGVPHHGQSLPSPQYSIVPPPPPPPPRKSPSATSPDVHAPGATSNSAAATPLPARNPWLNPNPVIKLAAGVAKAPKGRAAGHAAPTSAAAAAAAAANNANVVAAANVPPYASRSGGGALPSFAPSVPQPLASARSASCGGGVAASPAAAAAAAPNAALLSTRSSGAAAAILLNACSSPTATATTDPVALPPPLASPVRAAVGEPLGTGHVALGVPAAIGQPGRIPSQAQPQSHISLHPFQQYAAADQQQLRARQVSGGGGGGQHLVSATIVATDPDIGPLVAHKHASGDLDIASVAADYRPYSSYSSAHLPPGTAVAAVVTAAAIAGDLDSDSFSFFSTPPPVISDPSAIVDPTAAVANAIAGVLRDADGAAVAPIMYGMSGGVGAGVGAGTNFASLSAFAADPVWSPNVAVPAGIFPPAGNGLSAAAAAAAAAAATRAPRMPPPGFPSHAYGGAFAAGPLPSSGWAHPHPHAATSQPTSPAAPAAAPADELPLPPAGDRGSLASLGFVEDSTDSGSVGGGDEGAGGSCTICWSAPRQVGFLHGKTSHLCVCRRCASQLREGVHRCPMCRQLIERIIDIF